jgi:hypothetical protein
MIEGYRIRKFVSHVEEILHDGGPPAIEPLVKVAVGVVVVNPFADRFVEDLSSLTTPSAALGAELGRRAVALLGGRSRGVGDRQVDGVVVRADVEGVLVG